MRLLSMLGASALLLAISIAVPAGKIPYSDISLDLPKVSEIEQHFETVKGMDKHGLSQAKHEYRQALYRLVGLSSPFLNDFVLMLCITS